METLRQIRQLSPSVVNKIAAGEVIERPASVVKELLENAVDAGAQRIDVSIEQGGMQLVRVADDGCGIPAEQLPLAVASHATSKIESADDLFSVGTLGFRGEALASIAEVSHFCLRSRPRDSDAGFELNVTGGAAQPPAPCGCPVGTAVEVRNLFFNTPVRRKFLRTTATEMSHAVEAFMRIALAYPRVHFTLRHNERMVHELPPVDDWRQRIGVLFGRELAEALIWIEGDDGRVRVSGYVANPDHSRANNKMQYLFLNGRHIRDRSLQHALSEAYRGLLLQGRYPICFLRLELPAQDVDVNVHPTKLEVRFQDGGRIYSQVLGTLRTYFLSTDLTSRVQPVSDETSRPADAPVRPAGAASPELAQTVRNEVTRWARGQAAAVPEFRPFQPPLRFDHSAARPPAPPPPIAVSPAITPAADAGAAPPSSAAPVQTTTCRALQAHNRYLVTESDEGLMVIDQHALHERILYEELREKVLAGAVETQRLLVPETVHLPPTEAAAVRANRQLLAELGIEVEEFGGDTLLVTGYPAMLANVCPEELLRQVAEGLLEGQKVPERRDLLDELLHMISCKAAIKAGDRLSPEEISTLVEQRHRVQDSHHCPHGRPTTLVFTREELDRRFKRI